MNEICEKTSKLGNFLILGKELLNALRKYEDLVCSCVQEDIESVSPRASENIKKFPKFDVFSHISFIVFIFLFSICRHKISMPSNISESLLSDNFIFSVSVLFFVFFNSNIEP